MIISLTAWLRFSPSWGTDRGSIWIRCMAFFREYAPLQKLFGGGCGMLPRLDARSPLFPDALLDTAHCEYLQILLNWGIFGLIAWLVCLGLCMASAARKRDITAAALLAGVLSYAAQAAVNIAQAPSVCLFMLLLALCAAGDTP